MKRMTFKRIAEWIEKDWEELGFSEEDLPTLRKLLMEAKIEEGIIFKPREDQTGFTVCPSCGNRLFPRKSRRKIKGVHKKGRWKGKPIKKKKVVFTLKCKKCGYKEEVDEKKVKVIVKRKKTYWIEEKWVRDPETKEWKKIPRHLVRSGVRRTIIPRE